MEKEILERYHPIKTIDLTYNIFYGSEDYGDYIQEIDVLIKQLEDLKKQGCTHTYNDLQTGFRYLSKKESLIKKMEEENERHSNKIKELIYEYNNLDK